MIRIYTIGFTKKTAQQFFELLKANGITNLVDIRINNSSQLAGFAKSADLEYFLQKICNIKYQYITDFTPTKELLSDYQNKKITWIEYQKIYRQIIKTRKVIEKYDIENFNNSCFLCSEPTADQCHRKLLIEYFKESHPEIQIIHI